MKRLYFSLFLAGMVAINYNANAQNFKAKQKSQERTIKAAYKQGKITEREYLKLIDEQEKIKEAIFNMPKTTSGRHMKKMSFTTNW